MKNKKITQDKVVYFVNYILLALFSIAVLYPLIYVVSCSFSSGEALMSGRVKFLPVEPTLLSYKTVFQYDAIWTGYLNSIVYTFVGTIISIVLTLFAAYPLSDIHVPLTHLLSAARSFLLQPQLRETDACIKYPGKMSFVSLLP